MMPSQVRPHEQGSVLLVSLIMLVVLTLLAVSAINMSTVTLRTVNNSQIRAEAMSAAQRAIEGIINTNFTASIGSVAKTYSVQVDSNKDYDVVVATPCLKQLQSIRNTDLNLSDAEDVKCFDTSTNPWSACANTVWEFNSSVNDSFFGANVTVVQGVAIRMDNSAAIAYSTDPAMVCSGS